jgi:ATP-dependent RNA helicase DeaD
MEAKQLTNEGASPNSEPLSFSSIISHEKIRASLQALGLVKPTPVQKETLPRALAGKDLIVQAKTGSGKTFAFALPLLAKLEDLGDTVSKDTTYGLIVTPTRELAVQIRGVIESISPDIAPSCLIGGGNPRAQEKELDNDRRIVVGTPGRLLDFIRQGILVLNKAKYFVLDEADEMLSMGFIDDIRTILSKLPANDRQGLFVSATISPYVESLANSFLKSPERIIIQTPAEERPDITHYIVDVGIGVATKTAPLVYALENFSPRSAIIFCNTKADTELVEMILKRKGFKAEKMNSDLAQKQRENIMERMRSGDLKILIATDIAARGIDIDSVDLVVNYSIHDQAESYVHRTGRTGRAGRTGIALSIVGPQDFGGMHNLRKNLKHINFQKFEIPAK